MGWANYLMGVCKILKYAIEYLGIIFYFLFW